MSSKDNWSTHDLLAYPLLVLSGKAKPVVQQEPVESDSLPSYPSSRSAEGFALTHTVCEIEREQTFKVGSSGETLSKASTKKPSG